MPDKNVFDELSGQGDRPDPMRAAQGAFRAQLPKRFYKTAGVEERDGLFAVTLDGRIARTPARNVLAVPTRALAEAIAAEWQALDDVIDPALLPLTRIVNAALDGVADNAGAVAQDIAAFAGTDLICYRAADPEDLVRRQKEAWDRVVAWAGSELGADLRVTSGLSHVAQPPGVTDAVLRRLADRNAIDLAALSTITTLTGSAFLALAVDDGWLEPEAAWAAAHVDEAFQEERWGIDEEAAARRARRWRELEAAATILRLNR